MKNKKTVAVLIAVLVLVAAAMLLILQQNKPQTVQGAKAITLTVIYEDGSQKDFTVHTDAETLGEALLAEGLVQGSDGAYGLFVTTVDGVEAQDSLHQWWCFNDGEGNMLSTGIDQEPISDGGKYQAVLSTY